MRPIAAYDDANRQPVPRHHKKSGRFESLRPGDGLPVAQDVELEAERIGGTTRTIRREAVARAARERSEQERE